MKSVIRNLIIALVAMLALSACQSNLVRIKPTPTAAPTPLAGTSAGAAGAAARIVSEGKVVPAKSATLSFSAGGVVARAPVKVGQKIAAGDLLAQLDTAVLEFQLAQAEANVAGAAAKLKQLDQAPEEQAVAAAKQAVTAAQATYDKLLAGPNGADVAAAKAVLRASQQAYAAVAAGPTAESLNQLAAQMANAKAVLDQAQAAYDQIKDRADVGLLPQSLALQQATIQYHSAQSAYTAAKSHPTAAELAAAAAQVQQAQAALDRLTAKPGNADLETARSAVEGAKAQLAQLQKPASAEDRAVLEASLKASEASRDLAAAQINNAMLRAPFAGQIIRLNLGPGEYAAPGAPVVLLADPSTWHVETTGLTELNVADVSPGAPAIITFDAIPGLELTGKVGAIEPYGESKQGDIVYTATILLDQRDPRLRWNMTAKVKIG